MTPTLADIQALIAKEIDVPLDQVHAGTDLIDDLGMESLELIEVAMAAEERYGIEVTDDQIHEMKTPADMLRIFEEAQARKERAA